MQHSDDLSRLGRWIAELDVLLGLAIASRECDLVRPTVVAEPNVLDIIQGRHFLQELCVESFIPNDTHIAERDDRNSKGPLISRLLH